MRLDSSVSASKYASVTASYNVVLLGCERVGKTAFIEQLMRGTFRSDYEATTVETCIHKVGIGGDNYVLHICDSSGSKRFTRHRISYLSRAHGVLLFYSTTDRESLESLVGFVKDVKEAHQKTSAPDGIPILLVGTKRDDEINRAVTIANAENVSEKCLSLLSLKMWEMKKRQIEVAEGVSKFLRGAISSTLPVVEVSCLRSNEVQEVLRLLVLMIRGTRRGVVPVPATLPLSLDCFTMPQSLSLLPECPDSHADSIVRRQRSPTHGSERRLVSTEQPLRSGSRGGSLCSNNAGGGDAAESHSSHCDAGEVVSLDDVGNFDVALDNEGSAEAPILCRSIERSGGSIGGEKGRVSDVVRVSASDVCSRVAQGAPQLLQSNGSRGSSVLVTEVCAKPDAPREEFEEEGPIGRGSESMGGNNKKEVKKHVECIDFCALM
uniref:Uncharacterized protein TCIL3000_10_5300 n=1 Tax=Trypanosoma congolense (strain IL3000) TaxID=1068625 RepID=G0UWJ9_TRYCI|nr:unnamed protein product [Trypanosoma congolense IL3000]